MYSDGSNTDIPESSPASLNAVSEDGFLCKPSTATDVDPNTGATYHSEISSVITGQGFYPMPLMVEDGQGATSGILGTTGSGIPHPAWNYASDPGGLAASAYAAANEATSPWNFPAGDRDDDNSAISGTLLRRLLRRQHQHHEDGHGDRPDRLLPNHEHGRQLHRLAVKLQNGTEGPAARAAGFFPAARSRLPEPS